MRPIISWLSRSPTCGCAVCVLGVPRSRWALVSGHRCTASLQGSATTEDKHIYAYALDDIQIHDSVSINV